MENTNDSKSLCIVVCSIPNIVHKQQSNWQVKTTLKTGVRKLYGKEVRVTWQILLVDGDKESDMGLREGHDISMFFFLRCSGLTQQDLVRI